VSIFWFGYGNVRLTALIPVPAATLTELAFSELEGDDGTVLHSHLHCLLQAVPELWVSCARADAALKAYCAA
jgi:hypothetical protein